jgi:hypothetical protein
MAIQYITTCEPLVRYVQYLQRNICNRKDFVVDHIEGFMTSIMSERSKILNFTLSYSSEINGYFYHLRTFKITSRNLNEILRSYIPLGPRISYTGTTSNFFENLQRYLKFNLQHRRQVGNYISSNWEK